MLQIWLVRNLRAFKKNDGFKNSRFSRSDRLVPFGLGRRYCMGEQLARNEIFIFLADLLQQRRCGAIGLDVFRWIHINSDGFRWIHIHPDGFIKSFLRFLPPLHHAGPDIENFTSTLTTIPGYYTLLSCTVLHCSVLYCTVLYCTALHCTARH